MALEKPGRLREFFSPTLWPPCLDLSPSLNFRKGQSVSSILLCPSH